MPDGSARPFDPADFDAFLLDECQFEKYLTPDPLVGSALSELHDAGMKLVIMTNAPRTCARSCARARARKFEQLLGTRR